MKTNFLKISLLVAIVAILFNTSCKKPASHGLPQDWFIAGDHPASYRMGTDSSIAQSGIYSAMIKSIDKEIDGFGTLMQASSPDKFKGKRVRMSGYMKSENVSDSSGFWFRVDVDTVVVSFDNMQVGKDARPVLGTTDWKKYEIVLDVPENATAIAYGALLCGTGQLWFDNISFEVVDQNVKTTGISDTCTNKNPRKPKTILAEPINLDFEK
ncbi:MAG: hypothetical protein NTZ33_14095 [Bacteroidetes bacterium]|nr:hypothetical protein [Bacteroidota bacterium]